jgi:hypothetical protein
MTEGDPLARLPEVPAFGDVDGEVRADARNGLTGFI